ncbi:MAG: hypothetical protein ACP5RD_06085 [bacterium]
MNNKDNKINYLLNLVFYKHILNFYLQYIKESNSKIEENLKIFNEIIEILKNILFLVNNYILNLLKEMVIILNDLEAYKLISNIEENFNILNQDKFIEDKENNFKNEDKNNIIIVYQKLSNKFNLNLLKLKKIVNLIVLVYKEIFYFLSVNINNNVNIKEKDIKNLLKQLGNVSLFLFNLGFFREYILVSSFLYEFNLLKIKDNKEKIYKSIFKNSNIFEKLIEIINTIIN